MFRVTVCVVVAALLSVALGCGTRRPVKGPSAPPAPGRISTKGVTATGPNLLRNGDFQQRDMKDNTLPAGWRRLQGTNRTITLVEASPGSTNLVAQVSPDLEGKLWQTLAAELPLPDAPAVYLVTFEGRTLGAGTGRVTLNLRKKAREYERLGVIDSSGPEFKTYSFAASVPSSGGQAPELWLGQGDYHNTKCTIQYDNVTVKKGEVAAAPPTRP